MLPGVYKYCGPFNKLNLGEPIDELDEACLEHDKEYYQDKNLADDIFLKKLDKIPGINSAIAKTAINTKRFIDKYTNDISDKFLMPPVNDQKKRKIEDTENEQQEYCDMSSPIRCGQPSFIDTGFVADDTIGPSPDDVGYTSSGQGTTIASDRPPRIGDKNPIERKTFSRTLFHYLDAFDQPLDKCKFQFNKNSHKWTDMKFEHRCVEIPYADLRASATKAELQASLYTCTKWRVRKCGFRVSNVVPITDDLSSLQGTTTTNTTFNTRPWIMTYVDTNAAFFRNMTRAVEQVNNDYEHNIPENRDEGKLKHPVQYRKVPTETFQFQTKQKVTENIKEMNGEELMSLYNTGRWNVLRADQTWQYTWTNNTPGWFNASDFDALAGHITYGEIGNDSEMPVKINAFQNATDNWVPEKTNGKTTWNDMLTDEKVPSRSCLTQMPINPSDPPPVAVLDPIPILDSNSQAAKITFLITIDYFSEIEFEKPSGSPQFVGYLPRVPAATSRCPLNPEHKMNLNQWPQSLRTYTGTGYDSAFPAMR
ncbi:capsid [Octopus vulgaris]|uniref:Capsid n=1 Tax=Octopus vulgaris TaxID=6645 RepID=A0AA36F4J0_OCTVU|nr:capsid [Octopus vulgaris]